MKSCKMLGLSYVSSVIGFKVLTDRHVIFKAGFLNTRRFATMSQLLDKVPDVDIDDHGRFKYILINVSDPASKTDKLIIRGYARQEWHVGILEETVAQLKPLPALQVKCIGGGRIEHDPDAKTIKVYGYSQAFKKADHEVSVGLLKKKYPDYTFTWSDEGY